MLINGRPKNRRARPKRCYKRDCANAADSRPIDWSPTAAEVTSPGAPSGKSSPSTARAATHCQSLAANNIDGSVEGSLDFSPSWSCGPGAEERAGKPQPSRAGRGERRHKGRAAAGDDLSLEPDVYVRLLGSLGPGGHVVEAYDARLRP